MPRPSSTIRNYASALPRTFVQVEPIMLLGELFPPQRQMQESIFTRGIGNLLSVLHTLNGALVVIHDLATSGQISPYPRRVTRRRRSRSWVNDAASVSPDRLFAHGGNASRGSKEAESESNRVF